MASDLDEAADGSDEQARLHAAAQRLVERARSLNLGPGDAPAPSERAAFDDVIVEKYQKQGFALDDTAGPAEAPSRADVVLALATRVYAGLTEEEIDEIERIALEGPAWLPRCRE